MLCFTTYYQVKSEPKVFSFQKTFFLFLISCVSILAFAYLYFIWQGMQTGFYQKRLHSEIQNMSVSYHQLEAEYLNKISDLNAKNFENFGLVEVKNPKFVKAQIFVAVKQQ